MADNKPSPMPDVAPKTSRDGTPSPTPAQPETSTATTAPSANAAIHAATSQAETDATPAAEEQQALPELGDEGQGSVVDDFAFGSEQSSGGASVPSSVLTGHWSGGRRYQVVRDVRLHQHSQRRETVREHACRPSCILDGGSSAPNPFFRAPISKNAQHTIDLGTGSGAWASDVADMFPNDEWSKNPAATVSC